jgi:GT2 family glycosyltransferase
VAMATRSAERKKYRKPRLSDLTRSRRSLRRKQGKLISKESIHEAHYREGFAEGYREGVQSGIQSHPTMFEGTSIVIPTFNQLDMLRQCVSSIIENTDSPYEVIVVDNASTDGTADYLQQLGGQVRYRILDTNRGFAGAINRGLMMTKGRTIVLLNNDTLVTVNWLDNLLVCLNSDEQIGMVGPVTNYISGAQQIEVPYENVADMPKFARENNCSDPARWRRVDRLTGFCLVFRRELFEGIGYFDEGFEIGNFEDDDYNIRVRLLGKRLVIAQDSFIHHFGSVSMKALGEHFQEVNARNEIYYMNKWLDPHEWIHQSKQHRGLGQGSLAHTTYYYPEHIVVQAVGANVYWIEQGARRLVKGVLTLPSTRVSQIDLRRWPLGDPIPAEEVEQRWRGQEEAAAGFEEGVVLLPDGAAFHREGDTVRRIISTAALEAWNLHLKPLKTITPEVLKEQIHGMLIISPPMLRQDL